MKKRGFLAALLTANLCLNGFIVPAKATNDMIDTELYSQFYQAAYSYETNGISIYFIDAELVDLNNDQIPEMIFIYEDSRSDSCAPYTLEVYQYVPTQETAKCIYTDNMSFSNWPEAELELGSYNGKLAIRLHFTEWIGQPYESYTITTFDSSLSTQQETQYKFEDHPTQGDIPGGFSESEEAFNKLKNGFSKSKVLAICTNEKFYSASNTGKEYWELYYDFLDSLETQYWSSYKETLASKISASSISITDAMESLSMTDKIELVDFMQVYNDCNYDGSSLQMKDIYLGLYSSLRVYNSLYSSGYFSSRYNYNAIEGYSLYPSSYAWQGGSEMTLAEFDLLTRDLYGVIFDRTDYMLYENDPLFRLEFDENYATLYYELETDFLPIVNEYSDLELFYKLADNLYYGVFRVVPSNYYDDSHMPKSYGVALLGKFIRDGRTYWRCFYANQNSTPIPNDVLQNCILAVSPDSNIAFDYEKISGFTSFEQYIEELESQLTAIDDAPNAKALAEITNYINFGMQQCAAKAISGKNNCFDVEAKILQPIVSTLLDEANTVDQVLSEHNIQLNQQYQKIVRLDAAAAWDDAIQITFKPEIAATLEGADRLMIYLGDNRHAVSIDAQSFEALSGCTVQLQKVEKEENVYALSYVDASGADVTYSLSPLTVTLPADDALASVLLTYPGGSENWGGQYDALNQSISFEAPYTGEYSILNEQITLADIGELDEEYQQAIRFMVSKGYFSAPDGNFDPTGCLTRYDFAETLVKLFYAQQDGLITTFSDVPQDSIYYSYIAAGENKSIIQGYEDITFRGDNEVLIEEVIAFCSRTLMEKKNYLAPENPSAYLNYVDALQIPGWVQQEVALAARESLIDNGGILQPAFAISRADAALILYRLFMKLYELPPVQIKLAPEPEKAEFPIAVPVAVIGLAAVAGGGFIFLRKRKESCSKSQ